ncbi:UNVERIFIED_ORG: hypothetical protein BDU10_2520 [Burkholderia sp. CF145]
MAFSQRITAINYADPGDTLANMVKWRRDTLFNHALLVQKSDHGVQFFFPLVEMTLLLRLMFK